MDNWMDESIDSVAWNVTFTVPEGLMGPLLILPLSPTTVHFLVKL